MTDFGPLIANPVSLLLGAAAQFGIYIAFMLANATGLFTVGEQLLSVSSVVQTVRPLSM